MNPNKGGEWHSPTILTLFHPQLIINMACWIAMVLSPHAVQHAVQSSGTRSLLEDYQSMQCCRPKVTSQLRCRVATNTAVSHHY